MRYTSRGQTAIPSVVLLIAALLVATITAGVFFDLASRFGQQADRTGQATEEQTTSRIELVTDHIGSVSDDSVNEIRFVVGHNGGQTDLSRLQIQYATNVETATLEYNDGFQVEAIRGVADGTILRGETARARIVISISDNPLSEGDRGRITVLTTNGQEVTRQISVPPLDRNTVELT